MSRLLIVLLNIFIYKHVSGYLDTYVPNHRHALDMQLYEDVLDPELCEKQLQYMRENNTLLLLEFLDAGIRIPRGIFKGGFVDMGNYFQCLEISNETPDFVVEGKYCTINMPLEQDLELPDIPGLPLRTELGIRLKDLAKEREVLYKRERKEGKQRDLLSSSPVFSLALCLPTPCTTREFLDGFVINTTELGLTYEDNYCRMTNDKPYVAADYVALGVFGTIILLTILSTSYDVRHTVIQKRDPEKSNKLLKSFSIYTNTKRLVVYKPVNGAIECLDGVRALAMAWVIVGHTFVTQMNELNANPSDLLDYILSLPSVWITAGPITVDTFFMLSGFLIVYTCAGKFTGMKLLRNLHFFYLNRLLRMFPTLAAFILIQASLLNRVADGPNWRMVLENTNACRMNWWTTLLHVQNLVNPLQMCLPHTWYLAIDVQLHILSPLVLFWVLGRRKRIAWSALVMALATALIASSIYNTINKFSSGPVIPSRPDDQEDYMIYFYLHTLTRCSPFFVGMIYGYLMHLYRDRKFIMSMFHAVLIWICMGVLAASVLYVSNPIMQLDWDNQPVDTLINCLKRPIWAMAVGWLVFACAQGYGGPINWMLSLRMWKLLSRLSYAMYIVHYPLLFVVNSMTLVPVYFSVQKSIFKFLADFTQSFLVAFLLTVLVDSPCSVLIKHVMGGGPRTARKPAVEDLPSKFGAQEVPVTVFVTEQGKIGKS
ncbi:nose resistant to fluoxetine protein 6-like [Bombyx mandarina]|uniref:Nose resistant to fluoxetine protein 6-like n=1 Tax=Bombyx mandarina TaxID=7092 RepID=A0A6J2JMR7_BOMMA|nr:nose resistant to fluoxetine protein 6-like [Bombyx mandarina]